MTQMRSNRAPNRNNNRPKGRTPQMSMPKQPPNISGVVSGSHTFRYKQIDGIQDINLFVDDLAFTQCVALNSSTLSALWAYIRVDEIRMWAPAQVLSGTVQDPKVTSLTWTGDFSPNAEIFGTANVQTGVACVASRPSRLIEAGKWQQIGQGSNAVQLCTLRVPDQSIVDIKISFIYRDTDTGSPITTNPTAVTVTPGNIYYMPADAYFGSRKLIPMGLVTRA